MFISQLLEEQNKTIVMSFARMNPPTIGHELLLDKLAELGKIYDGDAILFLSQSQDKRKNPLDFKSKLQFVRELFRQINHGVSLNLNPDIKTPVDALNWASKHGYNRLVFVAGSDRVPGFKELIETYNGKPTKEGIIPFNFSRGITVVSSGARDADSDSATGISASKLRDYAKKGEKLAFFQGVPGKSLVTKQKLYSAVRKGMGLVDIEESYKTFYPGETGIIKKSIIRLQYVLDDLKEINQNNPQDFQFITQLKTLLGNIEQQVSQIPVKQITEGMVEFNPQDPMDSRFAPPEGVGSMNLRSWKKYLAKKLELLAKKAELYTSQKLIDDPYGWNAIYNELNPNSMNSMLLVIAKEIVNAHQELEQIRRKGGIKARGITK